MGKERGGRDLAVARLGRPAGGNWGRWFPPPQGLSTAAIAALSDLDFAELEPATAFGFVECVRRADELGDQRRDVVGICVGRYAELEDGVRLSYPACSG